MAQRHWFITGTSSGFGLEMTQQLLSRGDKVYATLRKPALLAKLAQEYEGQLYVAGLDVTDGAAVRRVVDGAFSTLGRIDVIVNNAGYGLFGAAEEVSDEQIRQVIDTNVIGSIQVVRAALPHLRRQGGGRILQVSSEGGQMTYPNFSLYHTSKWAIEGFVDAVAQEVAPFDIAFTLLEPGPAKTGFGTGMVSPPPMPEYDNTPAGEVRRAIAGGAFAITGDPVKMVAAMIATVDQQPAPKRLLLGSGSYTSVRTALLARLDEIEANKAVTLAMDIDS